MKIHTIVKSYVVILTLFYFGCNNQTITITESKTVEQAVKDYYKNMYDWPYGLTTDLELFFHYNRNEILNTLEIIEIIEIKEKDLAIAFTRFSIGTDIVRRGLWFHKINDSWGKTQSDFFTYGAESIGYKEKDDKVEFEELLEKKEKWEEDNPDTWWAQYFL